MYKKMENKPLARKEGKLDELKCILRTVSNTIHVILLTETWISNENQALDLRIPNYTHYYNYRSDSRGGGVSAYIHNNLKSNLSESIYSGGNNYLWVQLEKYALEIGVVYNPGHTNFNDFLDLYESQLQHRNRTIVFGDFNIDLLTKDKKTKQYTDLLKGAGHILLNKITTKYCTRESSTKRSIIDHISTNLKKDSFHVPLIDSPMSDHKQFYLEIKKIKPPAKQRRQYEAINYEKLTTLATELELNKQSYNYIQLENQLKDLIYKSKAIKTKILNLPRNDWINKEVISEIDNRNALWVEVKKNKDDDNLKIEFQAKSSYVSKFIQNTKNNYYYKEFTKCYHKPKRMWNLINNLANNKIKQACAPSKLSVDSKYITDPKEICEIFNKYFSTIGPMLANKINNTSYDNLSYILPEINLQTDRDLSRLEPCTISEIIQIIHNLDSHCSVGIDERGHGILQVQVIGKHFEQSRSYSLYYIKNTLP
ncbi:unnamed protein product [Euphydryas editha]|uniref:Endonuclease/exonuclease/phosphatase domain-containing protein n=1 Tax=Euphydryas editha TaxID=104508 RepID=A0AAU9TND9_EUPED|nr:unnamed protein product [Euphydryas editha]